jgi:ATP-dependent DNA helicase PIF1
MIANQQPELNEQFLKAYELMEKTDKTIFVTGKAGTGKSTLLGYFRRNTAKKIVVLAPTGVAALNVGGQTVHSFFRFKPDITLGKVKKLRQKETDGETVYQRVDAIVIDEISMVRADLLDCVDKFMRLNGNNRQLPFGGVQMIFIGDLYQLPPVVGREERRIFEDSYSSPYFFDAKLFEPGFEMALVELEKVYRQKDERLITVLNAIRNNTATEAHLRVLNEKCDPHFEPPPDDLYIYLTTTNAVAAEINDARLARLPGEPTVSEGVISGNFERKSFPTDVSLKVKIGAQVMLLNNDPGGRWVNGSIGRVTAVYEEDEIVLGVELSDGRPVEVSPYTWELFDFTFDPDKKSITAEKVGSFRQLPLKPAWAITIHKSQGKTFPKIILDIGRGAFAHGQTYVALSRCTDLEGLVLKKPLKKSHILMDWRVVDFVTQHQYRLAEQACSLEDRVGILKTAALNGETLEITYLKARDVKSRRAITPLLVEEMEYMGQGFLGLKAFCAARQAERVFRVDRILEIKFRGHNSGRE